MDYKSSVENLGQNVTALSYEATQAPNYTKVIDIDTQIPFVTATESNDVPIDSSDYIAPYMLTQKVTVRKYRLKK